MSSTWQSFNNLAALDEPAVVLRLVRRALAPRGIAFITAPNPDVQECLLPDVAPLKHSLDYYSLYDIVREEFPIVRMLGQMPFVGYTMAELAPLDEPEPTLDAGFVPGGTEEPEWFVAVAGAQPFEVDSFTVVQIPVAEVLQHCSERQLREQLRASRNAERNAVERLARLEAQQLDSDARVAEARRGAESAKQVIELKTELSRREALVASLEARAAAAEARSIDAHHRLEQLQQQLATDTASDVARLEAQLRERGERLRELEAQLKSVEMVGHQLLRDLEAARSAQPQRFGTETWSSAVPIQPEPTATDTSQSPDKTSAWVSHQADGSESVSLDLEEQPIADDRARLQADVLAATWRIDQLLAVIKRHSNAEKELAQVRNQLSHAETRLNEQLSILHQLESKTIRS